MRLIGLVRELERQRENSIDSIVDNRAWKAVPDETSGIRLTIPDYGEFPLTDWAHGQLADKLGIPRRYYERMRETGKTELLAENINAWLDVRERRLIRILDGRALYALVNVRLRSKH
jgi:hypothetical protein